MIRMSEQKDMSGDKTLSGGGFNINPVDIIMYLLSKWYWFVLSVSLFGGYAWYQYAKLPFIYSRSATVMIKDAYSNNIGRGLDRFNTYSYFLKWQRRVDGPISHAIEWVGRRSLFIFCIHTVELTAIPWYLMAAKYADHPVQGMLLQFVFSLVSIFAVTELLMRRKELGRKLRGGKPADKPRQRSKTRRYAAKH